MVYIMGNGSKTSCPSFPCSEFGTNCKYCFCPFYPCKCTNTGGKYLYVESGRVWDCTNCKYIHQDNVVDLLGINADEDDSYLIIKAWYKFQELINAKTIKEWMG